MGLLTSRAWRFFVNFLLLAFTLSALLLAAELTLRKFKPINIIRLNSRHYLLSGSDSMPYKPRPSSGPYNAEGIRSDHLYSLQKPAGVYRIAVIGDSLAFGYGLAAEETFSSQLEKRLNEEDALGSRRYEVINLGVPGYRISEVVRWFREKGLRYNPDLVIYWHWLDDVYLADEGFAKIAKNPVRRKIQQQHDVFQDRSENLWARLAARAFELHIVQHGVRVISSWRRPSSVHLTQKDKANFEKRLNPRVKDLYTGYVQKFRSGIYQDKAGYEKYFSAYTDYESFLQWNASLFKLSKTCEHYKIDSLLLLTPVLYTHAKDDYHWSGLNEWIREVASQHSIPSLDLTDAFSSYRGEELKVNEWDPEHPNVIAERLMVDPLRDFILRKNQ